jgi:aminopeptidase-like protein
MPLAELKEHIFTLPDAPDLVPYRTSYYNAFWGFCMAHRAFEELTDAGNYEVVIDSSLEDGTLTYGEYVHQGACEDEILLSAHICHPSLANDNCSGLALLTELARRLKGIKTRYTYRFLLAPGTIGAITWLARNESRVGRIKAGVVLSCVGDRAPPSYKKSRRGTALIDRAMAHVLEHTSPEATIEDFSPYGYDERQYCSPGFNLPVGLLQRSRFGKFPEYHTSADRMDFVDAEHLAHSFSVLLGVLHILENDRRLINLVPKCEPQLGRRRLYQSVGGDKDAQARNMAMLWVLNLSDGEHTLLDIAQRAGMSFAAIEAAAALLERSDLLAVV